MFLIYLKLHIAVFIAGFTGVFGRLISLDAFLLVYFRMALAAGIFYVFLVLTKRIVPLRPRVCFQSALVGATLMGHLVFFYASIKLSNVSIGTITLSASPFIAALIEPYFNHTKFRFSDVTFSVIAIVGLFLIFSFDTKFRLGIIVGLISALLSCLYSVFNKKVSSGRDVYNILNWQMIGGMVFLTMLFPFYLYFNGTSGIYFTASDVFYLLLLSTICTVGLYVMEVQLIQKISAFTMTLSLNLEPVYAIIIAMLLFNEAKEVNFSFYAGIALIILSVSLQCYQTVKISRKQKALELKKNTEN